MAQSSLAENIAAHVRTYPSVGMVKEIGTRPSNGRPKVKVVANGAYVDLQVKEADQPLVILRASTNNTASVVANVKEYLEKNKIAFQIAK